MYRLKQCIRSFFQGNDDSKEITFLGERALAFKDSEEYLLYKETVSVLRKQILEDAYVNGKNKHKSSEMLIGELNGLLLFEKVLDDFILRADEMRKNLKKKEAELKDESEFDAPYGEPVDLSDAATMIG